MVAVVKVGEMKKQPHVERLANRAELLHEPVIKAGEVSVLERCHDRPRERDGAGLDRIGRVFAALKKISGKILNECSMKRLSSDLNAVRTNAVVNFVERARRAARWRCHPIRRGR